MNKTLIIECISSMFENSTNVAVTHHEDGVSVSGDILSVSAAKILCENIGLQTSGYINRDEKLNKVTLNIYY